MTENTKVVMQYLKDHKNKNVTSKDVAKDTQLSVKTVDGVFTMAIQNKGLGFRTPAEIEDVDGSHKAVKYLNLTPAGYDMALD